MNALGADGVLASPTRLCWWLVTPSTDGRLDDANPGGPDRSGDPRPSASHAPRNGIATGTSTAVDETGTGDDEATAQADDSTRGRSVLVVGGSHGSVALLDCNEIWRKAAASVHAGMEASLVAGTTTGAAAGPSRGTSNAPSSDSLLGGGWGSQVFERLVGLGSPAADDDEPHFGAGAGPRSRSASRAGPGLQAYGWKSFAWRHAAARALDAPLLVSPAWSISGSDLGMESAVVDL